MEQTVTELPVGSPVDGAAQRSVIVTGASTRIGRATAERLARAGHLVVLGARRAEVCEKLAAKLRAEGATAFAAHLDLADTISIDEFVEAAAYLVGSVDVLVSNAGASRSLRSMSIDPDTMQPIFDTNMFGAQHLAARLIPSMVDNGGGDLIFVSPEVVGDAAWVGVLQAELEGTGVRASIMRPGLEPDDVARVIGSVLEYPEHMHLRLIEVVPSAPRTMEATN
jgi:NADP-dependent 3-hydroxy acid dehydrogenase YdfG